jgi:predicted DNA-binding protein
MKRIQVQLTEEQERRLRKRASASGTSIARAIREAVDRYVSEDDREARIQRALAVMSRFRDRDEADDLGANHDRYLAEIYGEQIRRGRRR